MLYLLMHRVEILEIFTANISFPNLEGIVGIFSNEDYIFNAIISLPVKPI